MHRFIIALVFGGLSFACVSIPGANAAMLISESEAGQPNSGDVGMVKRGLTRGPAIEQISPRPNSGVTSPLPLKLKFVIRNNIPIDPDSVKLTYLKAQSIDLTGRIKKHIAADGIDMAQAEVPPGTHLLRLDLKDKQGRVGTAVIKLTVTK